MSLDKSLENALDRLVKAEAERDVLAANVAKLREALEGANWLIVKLAAYEPLALAHGYHPSEADCATGARYRALIDAALGVKQEGG